MPGAKVVITISYVNLLKYQDGQYEFVFPMVVGPRYIPGRGYIAGRSAARRPAQRRSRAIRARRRSCSTRTGSRRPSRRRNPRGPRHLADRQPGRRPAAPGARVRPAPGRHVAGTAGPRATVTPARTSRTIPNKDFILRYTVAGSEMQRACSPMRRARHAGDRPARHAAAATSR